MSPQISLIALPTRMTTRAGNKEKHPGIVDLPESQRRDPVEIARARQEAEEAKKDKEEHTKKLSGVASLEDQYAREDEEREARRLADRAAAAEARTAPAKKGVLSSICAPYQSFSAFRNGSSCQACCDKENTCRT